MKKVKIAVLLLGIVMIALWLWTTQQMQIRNVILAAVFFWVSFAIHRGAHEIGHLIGGAVSGHKLLLLQLGPVGIRCSRPGKVQICFQNSKEGQCVMLPTRVKPLRYKAYHAGGVVANVVVVMGAVVLMTVGHQLIKLLALTLLVSGCMKLVGNCWPHIEKDSPNDGYILRLLKNDPEVQHDYLTYITLYAALFWGEMVCAEDYSYDRHTTEGKRLLFYEEIQTLRNVLRDASISTPE